MNEAGKLIGKNTGEAIKASSKAIDSVSSSVKAMGPSVDKAAASISKGADQFVASASDFGGQIQASTGELSEALKEFTSNSAEFSDGARLAAADAVDALGTAGSAASAAYYDAVASAAAAGIGGAEAASAGAVLIAAAAFGTKGIDAAAVKSLELDRDTAKQESDMLKVKLKELEEKFFLADAQFEQTMARSSASSLHWHASSSREDGFFVDFEFRHAGRDAEGVRHDAQGAVGHAAGGIDAREGRGHPVSQTSAG